MMPFHGLQEIHWIGKWPDHRSGQETRYSNCLLREAGIQFCSSRSNDEKGAVAIVASGWVGGGGGGGGLGRTYGGYFILINRFLVFLRFCFCAYGNAVSLYHFVSNGTRLGMDGYLLAVIQSCCSFGEGFPCYLPTLARLT